MPKPGSRTTYKYRDRFKATAVRLSEQQWATSAQSLIRAACGEQSPRYTNFVTAFKERSGYDYHVKVLQGIFQSAREDFEGGYISGEVFGDFVASDAGSVTGFVEQFLLSNFGNG